MNKLYSLLLLFFLCTFCNAQTLTWEWARSAQCQSSNGAGEGWNVASDDFGNVYVTGWFGHGDTSISFGAYTIYGTDTNQNFFLAKYDSIGNILWAKSAWQTGVIESWGIATDASGNVFVTGYFWGDSIAFDSDTLINPSNYWSSLFLVKYDSTGNVMWAKNPWGSTFVSSESFSAATDIYGNVYITGYYTSPNIIFGSYILTNAGSLDLFITKYDSAGNVLWAKSAGGMGSDRSYSVTCDVSGNPSITGSFGYPYIVFDTDTLFSINTLTDFIAKYDTSGNLLWAKNGKAPSGNDLGTGVTSHATNNVYMTGYFTGPYIAFDNDTLYYTQSWMVYNSFLVKFDSSGNVLWAKSFVGGYAFNMVSDLTDNVFLSGTMRNNLTGFISDSITFDTITLQLGLFVDPMFLVKYDSSGHALWALILPSGGDDNNGIALGTNENIYIGGDYIDAVPFIFGNDTLIGTGIEDVFVAKLGFASTVGISEIIQQAELFLYPNPFNEMLQIRNKKNEPSEIILYDMASRKLLQQKFTNSVTLNTEQLAKGLYVYEVRSRDGLRKKGKVMKD